jgi:hypothetical protein
MVRPELRKKPKKAPAWDEVDIQMQIEDAAEDAASSVRTVLAEQGINFDDNCWNQLLIRAMASVIHQTTT